jgi:hypothetical protein
VQNPCSRYLYGITDGAYTKIGISENPKNRLASLQVGNAKDLKINFLSLFLPRDCQKAERVIHKKLSDKNVRGEWFKTSPQEIEQILKEEHFKIRTDHFNEGLFIAKFANYAFLKREEDMKKWSDVILI